MSESLEHLDLIFPTGYVNSPITQPQGTPGFDWSSLVWSRSGVHWYRVWSHDTIKRLLSETVDGETLFVCRRPVPGEPAVQIAGYASNRGALSVELVTVDGAVYQAGRTPLPQHLEELPVEGINATRRCETRGAVVYDHDAFHMTAEEAAALTATWLFTQQLPGDEYDIVPFAPNDAPIDDWWV